MDIINAIPSTLGGLSAWCLAIGAALLLIFGAVKPAVTLAIIGGLGVAGAFGRVVAKVTSSGSQAASNVTASMFGAAVPAIFFIIVALLLYKYAYSRGGGGGVLAGAGGKGGKGGKGGLGGGGGKGGKVKTIAVNWALFVGGAALGAVIGTIPFVYTVGNQVVGAVHSLVASAF